MSRNAISDLVSLARASLEAGKAQTIYFEAPANETWEEDDEIEYDE